MALGFDGRVGEIQRQCVTHKQQNYTARRRRRGTALVLGMITLALEMPQGFVQDDACAAWGGSTVPRAHNRGQRDMLMAWQG
eukprot:7475540-Alexandrium_andersonii.AAC.1